MLYLSSPYGLIHIPSQTEYTIYTEDYYLDAEGNVYAQAPHSGVYSYGDLIVETPTQRYIFSRLYAAYDYCAKILRQIHLCCGNPPIFIQLEDLNSVHGFQPEGGYTVVRKETDSHACFAGSE